MTIYEQILRVVQKGHADSSMSNKSVESDLDKAVLLKVAQIDNKDLVNKLNRILKIASMTDLPSVEIPDAIIKTIVKVK